MILCEGGHGSDILRNAQGLTDHSIGSHKAMWLATLLAHGGGGDEAFDFEASPTATAVRARGRSRLRKGAASCLCVSGAKPALTGSFAATLQLHGSMVFGEV